MGCTSPGAKHPTAPASELAIAYTRAVTQESTDSLADDGYLDVIDEAVEDPEAPDALGALIASVDALVFEESGSGRRMPIVERSREARQRTVLRLRQAWEALDGESAGAAPPMRYFLAKALHELAMYSGEARGAKIWGERRGCASAATFVGPLSSTPLTDLTAPARVQAIGKLLPQYPSFGSFRPSVVPTPVFADACRLSKRSASVDTGLFEVVVDVDNPTAQELTVVLTSSAAAVVDVGGVKAFDRTFDLGGRDVTRVGRISVREGKARIVVHLADRGDVSPIEIAVLDRQGLPLALSAPKPGDATGAQGEKGGGAWRFVASANDRAETFLVQAAALLAVGDARTAEHAIEERYAKPGPKSPVESLLYVRAMEAAGDKHETDRVQKTRAIAEALKTDAPKSWEARLLAAELIERRKGAGEGTIAALDTLGVTTPTSDLSKVEVPELVRLLDLADAAGIEVLTLRVYDEIQKRVPGSSVAWRAEPYVKRRVGRDAVTSECNGGGSRASSACAQAHFMVGDRKAALGEITRLRALRASPTFLLDLEMQIAIAQGDKTRALALYDATPVGDRSLLSILPLLTGDLRPEAMRRIHRDRLTTFDGTTTMARLGPLFDEPNVDALRLEKEGAALVQKDRTAPTMPGAATLVLKHVEQYGLDESGFLTTLFYDLRRVAGTTDVDQASFVAPPAIDGRGGDFLIRRRIHKKDGRVLEPDAARGALQGGSDLSQLEQGDYVEIVRIGFFSPNAQAELTIDTPDLMPERVSVKDAEVSFRLPEKLPLSMWTHPMLGAPKEERRSGYKLLRYALNDKAARRLEDGVPYLEQGVRASVGTQTWPNIARAMSDAVRALDDHDPFVTRYAREAAGAPLDGLPRDRKLVEAVVAHTGKIIKQPSRGELSDMAGQFSGGSQNSAARIMIESGQGSRSWVIYRTLRELRFDVSLAISEVQPFSNRADFPPHAGRFVYPLVVVRLGNEEIWIDADVEGSPLPPGNVSPELRGRSALLADGKIVPVRASDQTAVDSVVSELTVDDAGTAKGKVTLQLRGRLAGSLSEAFNTIVGGDRKELLRSVVMGFVPWATVDDVRLMSKEGSWEVVIAADVTIAGFAQPEGRSTGAGKVWIVPGIPPVPRGGSGTLAQAYASAGGRQSALSIDFAMAYTLKRTIHMPKGAVPTRVPEATSIKSDRILAQRKTTIESGTMVDEVNMVLPSGTVDPSEFTKFVADLEATDGGFLASTRFEVRP